MAQIIERDKEKPLATQETKLLEHFTKRYQELVKKSDEDINIKYQKFYEYI